MPEVPVVAWALFDSVGTDTGWPELAVGLTAAGVAEFYWPACTPDIVAELEQGSRGYLIPPQD